MFIRIIRRLLPVIPVFFSITIVCFLIILLLPGGIAWKAAWKAAGKAIKGITAGSGLVQTRVFPAEEIERCREIYGFDKPIITQYIRWMSTIFSGDLGDSFVTRRPVLAEIALRVPVSLAFCLAGFFTAFLVCMIAGIAAACNPALLFKAIIKRKTIWDRICGIIIFTGYSIPGFALGLLMLLFFRERLFFPVFDAYVNPWAGSWYAAVASHPHLMIPPIVCYAVGGFAFLASSINHYLSAELGKGYVKTALAKGLDFKKTIMRHALRNAFIPILRKFRNFFAVFLTGSILIESIFHIPGIGSLGYESVVRRDYPVVIGLVLVYSLLHVGVRIIIDLCLAIADPLDRGE